MSGVNKALLVGRLGRDPEARNLDGGKTVASFSIATSETWKDNSGERQEKTTWHNIVMWGKLAGIATEYLKKGSLVYIEGRIQHREWEDKEGIKRQTTEVIASTMVMLGQSGDKPEASGGDSSSNQPEGGDDFEDPEIPF
jgi:single-strand DNA-binding protein